MKHLPRHTRVYVKTYYITCCTECPFCADEIRGNYTCKHPQHPLIGKKVLILADNRKYLQSDGIIHVRDDCPLEFAQPAEEDDEA